MPASVALPVVSRATYGPGTFRAQRTGKPGRRSVCSRWELSTRDMDHPDCLLPGAVAAADRNWSWRRRRPGGPPVSMAAFALGAGVSLVTSWVLVSRLERVGERVGLSEALLGIPARAADARDHGLGDCPGPSPTCRWGPG